MCINKKDKMLPSMQSRTKAGCRSKQALLICGFRIEEMMFKEKRGQIRR